MSIPGLNSALLVLAQDSVARDVQEAVFDANVLVAAAIALAAGLISFASPCVVPLVPGYLSFMTGLSGEEIAEGGAVRKGRVLLGSVLFVIGFAIPFTMLGFAFGTVNFLSTNTIARVVMGLVIASLGLLMARGTLMREFRVMDRAPVNGMVGAPVLGFVFGVGWTPCLGPTAGAILTLSASTAGGVSYRGAFLGFVYAFGLGIPFILFGLLFKRAAGALDVLKRNARRLQIVGGAMLVVLGLAMAVGWWDVFIRWLRPLINGFEAPI